VPIGVLRSPWNSDSQPCLMTLRTSLFHSYAVNNNTLAAGRLRLILRAAQRADRETVRQQSGPNEVLCTAYIARPELCKSAGSC
jgi:hypothetical protein